MTRAEWLGYTPITTEAEAWLTRLWRQHDLPEEPDFSHWSLEYAREVYEVIQAFTQPELVREFEEAGYDAHNRLCKALLVTDVWDDDKAKQHWVPMGWKPPQVEELPSSAG